MESQPQNPEFRNNPENFHPCLKKLKDFNVFPQSNLQCLRFYILVNSYGHVEMVS